MCGIFGVLNRNQKPVDLAFVRRGTSALAHRGPDDEGYLLVNTFSSDVRSCSGVDTIPDLNLPSLDFLAGGDFDLALGFRRLSILDVSAAGHQPMASSDGTCWIVYNGEVYNYVELRDELKTHGYQFHTRSDTEVILAAYQYWGVDCLKRLEGMWAFALWDSNRRHLFFARDRFGIKPFYYTTNQHGVVFASEIKALLEAQKVSARVNAQRVYDYLTFGITDSGDATLFADIQQLPGAHYMVVPVDKLNAPRIERYWKIDLDNRVDISFDEAANQLRELFLESARLHLRSDVPVGTALSGGIDSSAIVMGVRQLDRNLNIHTFSYSADDPSLDEERWVNIVAAASGATSHTVTPTTSELVNDLDVLISSQDEPFGSTSIYAQYRVFKLAREHGIKVMLDGQGADEMLAGYRFYAVTRAASLARQGNWMEAARFLSRISKLPGGGRANLFASTGGMLLPDELRALVRNVWGKESVPKWLDRDWFRERDVVAAYSTRSNGNKRLQDQLHDSLVESSLPMLLRYEDRNSMAHSIESRVPFLTAALSEFIFSLPEQYLIDAEGTSKSVFRKAMRGIVPDAILNRRDKIAFATPERQWLTALRPWVDALLHKNSCDIPVLNVPNLLKEWEHILSGRRPFDFRVWRWLNLIRWAQKFQVNFN